MKYLKTEVAVGFFVLAGIIAAVVLSLKVAGLVLNSDSDVYTLHAKFDNIGSLKLRAPVKIGGVLVGRVSGIRLDPENMSPVVDLEIQASCDKLSSESRASIQTAGIIGEQYISITPGFYDEDAGTTYLKNGDYFEDTGSALVLEDLIGKFLYSAGPSSKSGDAKEGDKSAEAGK
jgi:phospholipid/cholesterol/gamma-HCH transport system substrate-binding protein